MSTGGLLVRANALPQVRIGTQTWMAANYDFNGSDVNGVFTNVNSYGKLYTWTEANAILYPGWHLPTYEEYLTLITNLGGDTVAGGKLKASGTTYWTTPNTGADNSSGFDARGAGIYSDSTGYLLFNQQAWFWTSSRLGGYAYVICLTNTSNSVFVNGIDYTLQSKYSVRLLRNT